jgi:tRNA threonylcarbamoyladenosine modification (KEOPS) complex  Pcc1 subunit
MIMRCMLKIEFPDDKAVEAAVKAVSHEGNVGNRATSKVMKKDKTLVVGINADDAVALRASANAYLRALQVFESIEEVSR